MENIIALAGYRFLLVLFWIYLSRIQVWISMAENVFNLHFVQIGKSVNVNNIILDLGLQGFYQYALGFGGNREPEKTYVLPDKKSTGFGMKLGVRSLFNSISHNLLRIGKQGRLNKYEFNY